MATFFIADTHFGHENIIRLSGRPFTSLDEMNDTLLRNWNAHVKNSDDIRALNAGVDINYFIPVTLDELIQYNSFFKNQ